MQYKILFFFEGLYSQKNTTLKNFKIENKENKINNTKKLIKL